MAPKTGQVAGPSERADLRWKSGSRYIPAGWILECGTQPRSRSDGSDTDMLPALKGRGSRVPHQAALRMLPASTGRLVRCPSAGFNAQSARRKTLIAALVSALASWLQDVQTNRA